MSRIDNSVKNIKFSIVGQVVSFIFAFITRMVFVRTLSQTYLGLSGLFSNILLLLSFAELGIGSAIIYSMYKPLAENNDETISALMNFYKKAYTIVGFFIIVIGFFLTPFLSYFIKSIPEIPQFNLIYFLYILNTASTYFFVYKRSLLIADQKKYIDSLYYSFFFIVRNIVQIFVLLLTKSFIYYLIIQILMNVVENFSISKKIEKMYPFIFNKQKVKMKETEKKEIFKNTRAMMSHKIGGIVVVGTDNLLISKFVGIIEVGIYSNYILITNALKEFSNIIFQSIKSSVGNLGVTETQEKNMFIFECSNLVAYWLFSFASISLLVLFNPFIKIWLGSNYLFSNRVVFLIVINFFLVGRRQAVLTFRDAYGLFWYDRLKPIFEIIINLFFSILLAKYIGIEGIILGTILSLLLTGFWIEPLVLYKYGFKKSVKSYFKKYMYDTFLTIGVALITIFVASFFKDLTFINFIIKSFIALIIPNSIYFIIFRKTEEFKYLINLLNKKRETNEKKLHI